MRFDRGLLQLRPEWFDRREMMLFKGCSGQAWPHCRRPIRWGTSMAFDEMLAERVRRALAGRRGVVEKRMFGGLAFMLRGNMCCGVLGHDLVVRVGPPAHETELKRPHARVMDFTHRPMKGYLYVAPKGVATAASLRARLKPALAFVATLPRK